MKLISDFDGVLTELSREALRVKEIFLREWECHAAKAGLKAAALFEAAVSTVRQMPGQNGWEIHGRISAYADEDPFIFNNALGAWLDRQTGHAELRTHADVLANGGIADFKALAQLAYVAMVEEVMQGTVTPIDPHTAGVTRQLIGKGAEIIVVSNSVSDRILDIFSKNGIAATAHPERRQRTIRVRGAAQKTELANGRPVQTMVCGGRTIEVSRPIYEAMIREERPDAVMGDVFSLDLALPVHLARTEPGLFPNGLKVILRRQAYTPAWVVDYFSQSREEGIDFHILDRLEDLPKLLQS